MTFAFARALIRIRPAQFTTSAQRDKFQFPMVSCAILMDLMTPLEVAI
jgi:hypothetical protein